MPASAQELIATISSANSIPALIQRIIVRPEVRQVVDVINGGPGSGNFGHRGIPGHRGGSLPKSGGGGMVAAPSYQPVAPAYQPAPAMSSKERKKYETTTAKKAELLSEHAGTLEKTTSRMFGSAESNQRVAQAHLIAARMLDAAAMQQSTMAEPEKVKSLLAKKAQHEKMADKRLRSAGWKGTIGDFAGSMGKSMIEGALGAPIDIAAEALAQQVGAAASGAAIESVKGAYGSAKESLMERRAEKIKADKAAEKVATIPEAAGVLSESQWQARQEQYGKVRRGEEKAKTKVTGLGSVVKSAAGKAAARGKSSIARLGQETGTIKWIKADAEDIKLGEAALKKNGVAVLKDITGKIDKVGYVEGTGRSVAGQGYQEAISRVRRQRGMASEPLTDIEQAAAMQRESRAFLTSKGLTTTGEGSRSRKFSQAQMRAEIRRAMAEERARPGGLAASEEGFVELQDPPVVHSEISLLIANISGRTRVETLNGREYIVAPVTMIVEGVLNGSKGPLFYPESEISKDPQAWNGMPIVVNHPMEGGVPVSARSPRVIEKIGIGYIFNSRYNEKKLVAEGWFDTTKVQAVNSQILANLKAGKPIELSTGLFTDNEPFEGTWNGKQYTFIARNYRPDHLAILVGSKGACSVRDGCGVLVNKDEDAQDISQPVANIIKKIGGKHCVFSHAGRNLGGCGSEEKAKKRLQQVEYFKHKGVANEHEEVQNILAGILHVGKIARTAVGLATKPIRAVKAVGTGIKAGATKTATIAPKSVSLRRATQGGVKLGAMGRSVVKPAVIQAKRAGLRAKGFIKKAPKRILKAAVPVAGYGAYTESARGL